MGKKNDAGRDRSDILGIGKCIYAIYVETRAIKVLATGELFRAT